MISHVLRGRLPVARRARATCRSCAGASGSPARSRSAGTGACRARRPRVTAWPGEPLRPAVAAEARVRRLDRVRHVALPAPAGSCSPRSGWCRLRARPPSMVAARRCMPESAPMKVREAKPVTSEARQCPSMVGAATMPARARTTEVRLRGFPGEIAVPEQRIACARLRRSAQWRARTTRAVGQRRRTPDRDARTSLACSPPPSWPASGSADAMAARARLGARAPRVAAARRRSRCSPPITARRSTGRASSPRTSRCVLERRAPAALRACCTSRSSTPRWSARRWPVPRIDTVGDLAARLELDAGQLAWLADVRGLERPARPSGCATTRYVRVPRRPARRA